MADVQLSVYVFPLFSPSCSLFVAPLPSLCPSLLLRFTLPPLSLLISFSSLSFSLSLLLSWSLCHSRRDEEDWPLVLAVSHHYLWERDQRKKEAGVCNRKIQWSLSDSCVCISLCVSMVCGYSRVCSGSLGKCGSSAWIVLTWRCVCRPLTRTWRRPRISYDSTSP